MTFGGETLQMRAGRKERCVELIYKEESYRIIGSCFEVYNEKGCGFLEAVYHECLEIEFETRKIAFVSRKPLRLAYKTRPLMQTYIANFVCFERIVVELKAISALTDAHRAQMLNYLNATACRLGPLINFGHHPTLEYDRLVL